MASSRRRRIRANREELLRAREVHRPREATAHAERMRGVNEAMIKGMAWTAIVILLLVAILLVLVA